MTRLAAILRRFVRRGAAEPRAADAEILARLARIARAERAREAAGRPGRPAAAH